MLFTSFCFAVAGVLYLAIWVVWGYVNGRGGHGIREGGRALSPRRSSPRRFLKPFLWRMTSSSGKGPNYELVDRMA